MKRTRKHHSIDFTDFWLWVKAHGLVCEPEFKFHPTRKWRLDLAILDHKLGIEVEGLVAKGHSRHTTLAGYRADCEKYAQAIVCGWRVLRYTQDQWKKGLQFIDLDALLHGGTPAGKQQPAINSDTFKRLLKKETP